MREDIIVNGRIIHFRRRGLAYDPGDLVTVRDYEVTMVAHVTAMNRLTGEKVLDKDLRGRTTLRFDDDLPSAERQAIPLMAEDLARKITFNLVDGDF